MNDNKLLFEYICEDGKIKHRKRWDGSMFDNLYPFRKGDLVLITDWGGRYTSYTSAFVRFCGTDKPPYYSGFCYYENILNHRLFKIKDIAEHTNSPGQVVCYLEDNERRGVVMSIECLRPFKTYPLRPGETNKVYLEKIKQV